MPRFFLTLEYDGRPFHGWQRQTNGPSVQAALEAAVLALSGQTVRAVAAGRTDAGVHATGQVCHLDLDTKLTPETLQAALNFHLKPAPVAVLALRRVGDDLHARFSALSRSYRYRIVNRRAPLALERGRAWLVTTPLKAERMHEAAQRLVGRHDFTSFRSSQCQAASAEKTLDLLVVEREGEEIVILARARSFLHHQMRNMVGTLKRVGEGRWRVDDVERALAARDRSAAGATAPPDGLYLTAVAYPPLAGPEPARPAVAGRS
jgi:tRNA pseudouridine38-40 synthase